MRARQAGTMRSPLLGAGFAASLVAALALGWFLRRTGDPAVEQPIPGVPPPAPVSAGSDRGQGAANPAHKSEPEETPPSPHAAATPASIEAVLRGKGTHSQKVAALREARKPGVDPALGTFVIALEQGRAEPDLREAALRLLIESAAASAAARRVLLTQVGGLDRTDPWREPVLAALLSAGSAEELTACGEVIFQERDAERVAVLARALAVNPSAEAQAMLLDVVARHPDGDARHRAEEERTGRFCPDHARGSEEE